MRWILLDVALALVALGLLAVVGLGLWRRVKALGDAVSRAGDLVEQATTTLGELQVPGAAGARPAPERPPA